jgi:S-adenosylmethionine hydrolase
MRRAQPFMIDFGTANDAVAIFRAVIVGIVPDRGRRAFSGRRYALLSCRHGFSWSGGSGRRYFAQGRDRETKKGQYFVVPDNGLITPVADRDGVEGMISDSLVTNWARRCR